jgi:hypothetical protein
VGHCGLDLCGLTHGPVAESLENYDKFPASLKAGSLLTSWAIISLTETTLIR